MVKLSIPMMPTKSFQMIRQESLYSSAIQKRKPLQTYAERKDTIIWNNFWHPIIFAKDLEALPSLPAISCQQNTELQSPRIYKDFHYHGWTEQLSLYSSNTLRRERPSNPLRRERNSTSQVLCGWVCAPCEREAELTRDLHELGNQNN